MNRDTVVRLQTVFDLLRESFELARRNKTEHWHFAVNIAQLFAAGATEPDLRELVMTGISQHGIENTLPGTNRRTFIQASSNFGEKSCFVLSPEGVNVMNEAGIQKWTANGVIQIKPSWDASTNELRIAGQLIKRFKWHAPNQERLILAFEKEGWPEKIDDPLPPDEMVDAKRRLHDTIKCLNRRHIRDLIRFHGDGTGEGVIWRISAPKPEPVFQ